MISFPRLRPVPASSAETRHAEAMLGSASPRKSQRRDRRQVARRPICWFRMPLQGKERVIAVHAAAITTTASTKFRRAGR